MTKKAVLVVPHRDDELLQMGAFLTEFSGQINLVLTHANDYLMGDEMNQDRLMFYDSMQEIYRYRDRRGFESVFVEEIPYRDPHRILSTLDDILEPMKHIDYFVFSAETSHASHTECSDICMSAMRNETLYKTDNILMASYPVKDLGISRPKDTDNENTFFKLSMDSADLLIMCLREHYRQKATIGRGSNAENFELWLRYNGRKIATDFAVPYISIRTLIKEA